MRDTTIVSAWTSKPSFMFWYFLLAACSARTSEVLRFCLFIVLVGVALRRSPANYSCHLQEAGAPALSRSYAPRSPLYALLGLGISLLAPATFAQTWQTVDDFQYVSGMA